MEPTLVKLESCELNGDAIVPNTMTTMQSHHYGSVPSNFHDYNRQYAHYQPVMHNMPDHISFDQHRPIQVEAPTAQPVYNSIIKSESEYNPTHIPSLDVNNGNQMSYMDGSEEADLQTSDFDDIPVIVNGKYFKIIEEMNATEHQRVTRGIIAICQYCSREKARPIHGSMRITSNFVRHLKTLHPERYEEFFIERQNSTRSQRGRRGRKRKISQSEGQNGNNLKTEGYIDNEANVQSPEATATYYEDTQPSSANNSNNADNTDMYSAESNDTHLSDESMEKKVNLTSCQLACDPNEIPTILNGKYFKIIEQDMHSNRVSISVIAACQFCDTDKLVKGPLKVTSNFVQHLRSHHFKEYNMYLQEKFNSSTRCRRSLNRQPAQLPFTEKVLNFILLSNVPVSVVEEPSFIELFRGTGLTMCSCAQLLVRLDDTHACFVENIKRSLQEVPYICAAADIWTSGNKHYFGYCGFWLDSELKRQMAVLACVRLSDRPSYNEIKTVIGQIHCKYDLNTDKITCTLIGGVQEFENTYHNFSIKSACSEYYGNDFNFSISTAQHLLNQLPKQLNRVDDSLHLLTVFDFSNILTSHKMLQHALMRCLNILNRFSDFEADKMASCLFDGHLVLSDVRWPTWYISLGQLLKHKNKIDELCRLLKVDKFTPLEIEYLDDFCVLLKPIADALEFLQQDTYLYYGYFLPTLVTIKVKLKKLHECSRLKHLHAMAQQMSEALHNRFSKYFELNSECNDAIIAAIVCPAVKMRFVEALRDTAGLVTTETLMQLFVDYAQEFYVDNERSKNVREERPPSVDSFLCFNSDDNEDAVSENKPSFTIRRELASYLHDEDKTLECLSRYPLVKKVFHKYNTLPPTSVALENFFHTFLHMLSGQRGQQLTDEHFERLVLTKANKIL